jgi:hypothetical protein
VPWQAWFEIWRLPPAEVLVRDSLTAGDSKAWLRAHVARDELVFSTGDDHAYYVSQLRIAEILNQPETASATLDVWDGARLVRTLRRLGGRWVLDSRHWSGDYWTRVSRRFRQLALSHPSAIVFLGRSSAVVDLERLEEDLRESCVPAEALPWAPYLGSYQGDPADSFDVLEHFY